jgi:hypothetical protein
MPFPILFKLKLVLLTIVHDHFKNVDYTRVMGVVFSQSLLIQSVVANRQLTAS